MNLKIKFRESFRPFAPSRASREHVARILRDHARSWHPSPYMLLVADVHGVETAGRRDERRSGGGLDKPQGRPRSD